MIGFRFFFSFLVAFFLAGFVPPECREGLQSEVCATSRACICPVIAPFFWPQRLCVCVCWAGHRIILGSSSSSSKKLTVNCMWTELARKATEEDSKQQQQQLSSPVSWSSFERDGARPNPLFFLTGDYYFHQLRLGGGKMFFLSCLSVCVFSLWFHALENQSWKISARLCR